MNQMPEDCVERLRTREELAMTTDNKNKNDNGAARPSNGRRIPNLIVQIRPGLYTVVQSNSIFVECQTDSEPSTPPVATKSDVGLLEPARAR